MIFFHFPKFEKMARDLERLPFVARGTFAVERFANGELHATVHSRVAGKDCAILGTIAPPEENIFSLFLLAHTLKKEGARSVTAVIPYLSYARHDKAKPGEGLTMQWVGALAKASGVDEIVTIDLHGERDRKLSVVPITGIPTSALFADVVRARGFGGATIVAPDKGALPRARALRKELGIKAPVAYFKKKRTARTVKQSGLFGTVGPRAVIFDDMIDTGKTLVLACDSLRRKGVRKIAIVATHGIFSHPIWKKLLRPSVELLACTDSVPPVAGTGRVRRVSITPLLKEEFLRRHARKTWR